MRKKALRPDDIFDYAAAFHAKAVADGKSLVLRYPKLKDVARKYRVRQEEIETLVEEGSKKGYLGIVAGFGGARGYWVIPVPGDRMIEAY